MVTSDATIITDGLASGFGLGLGFRLLALGSGSRPVDVLAHECVGK
jgi:hypothetical protein